MATVDVMIVVDTETIVATYGTNTNPSKPCLVSPRLIHMVTQQADAIRGNGDGTLVLTVETADEIRWHATSATLHSTYSVVLYEFNAVLGRDLITAPQTNLAQIRVPLPNTNHILIPDIQTIEASYWSANAQRPGNLSYHFSFMIFDHQGSVQGYYMKILDFIHIRE